MENFLKQNLWNLIITFAAIVIAFTTQSQRITSVEAQALEAKQQLVEYSGLVERVIKLEENRTVTTSDISEIKKDVKTLLLLHGQEMK